MTTRTKFDFRGFPFLVFVHLVSASNADISNFIPTASLIFFALPNDSLQTKTEI